jgi:L-alanine-DL-glutamate epimerase-like enolase superfamily enzyme
VKITGVEAFAIRYPLREPIKDATHDLTLYELTVVRVHTDEGLVGHGFSSATHGGAGVIAHVVREMLTPVLVGRDPFHVRGLWDEMFWRTQIIGRAGANRLATGAVDIALWDLNARALGVPLWKLLGGTGVESFPLYSTDAGWLSFPQDEMLAKMRRALDAGFHGLKMKIGSPDPRADLRRVAAVREFIGPDVALMVDVNTHWDLSTALRFGPELDAFDIGWLEEPMNQHDVKGHAQLQSLMKAPLLVGENLTSLSLFRDFIEQRALRLAQPDVTRLGGVTRWLDVAALARANNLRVVPACWDSMQVSIHLAAATPEVHLMEHLDWTLDIFEERLRIENGRLYVPDGPGVGCTVRADVVERYRMPEAAA